MQQPGAEFSFQRPDSGGHCGLHDAQPRGGAGEAVLLHDRDEVLEVTQLHDRLPAVESMVSIVVISIHRWT